MENKFIDLLRQLSSGDLEHYLLRLRLLSTLSEFPEGFKRDYLERLNAMQGEESTA